MSTYTVCMAKAKKTVARFTSIRKRLKISQAQAARRIGVNLRTWQAWEYGTRTPSSAANMLIDMLSAEKI